MTHPNAVLDVEAMTVDIATDHGRTRVVDDVSLHILPGEALGLVGESGSGKSVLSRSAMGLHGDDDAFSITGHSRVDGHDMTGVPVAKLRNRWGADISIVLQDPLASLNPVRRVGVQITETIRSHRPGVKRSEAAAIALELLRKVGIADPSRRLHAFPHELSGGMRQRAMIAIALSGDPSILIADEPTTALDVTVQAQILDLLDRERRARRMGLLLVTHDLSIVAARTDRVAVMYAGQIVEEAPTEAIFAGPRMPYTRALLDAVPLLTGPTHIRLAAIPGSPPNLAEPITGCRFAARCAFTQPRCRDEAPLLRDVDGSTGHRVRCHFPLQQTSAPVAAPSSQTNGGRVTPWP